MRVEESIEIARPPDAVWDFVVDPTQDPRWCPKVQRVDPAGERRWRVIHKPVPFRPPMELTLEQREIDRPVRLALRQEDEASVFDVEYRLEPAPTGTRLTQASDFEWKKLPGFLHGTFAHGVRRDIRGQLKSLKRLVEAES